MILSRFAPSITAWAVTLLAVAAVAATIRMVAPDYAEVRAGRPDAGYLESGDCRKCHETNYSTWHSTFHRTMTQEADQKSVLGDFERENTITYQGVRTEMVRENGRYWMNFTGVDGEKQQLEVVRTVGSRRIQQYLTKSGDQWVRLPIAYDLVQNRWMHLNGSFFYPDGSDYKQHVAEWNLNCVFCHNVKAQPGFGLDHPIAEYGGRRIGHCLRRLSRTGRRARPTRSFSGDSISLACGRSGRSASRRDQPC